MPTDAQVPVLLFFSLDTQWRTGGMTGARTGLDYAAIEPAARCLGVTPDAQLLGDLRVMEREALATWAETRR